MTEMKNFPKDGEIVQCTVKKILHNSVFVKLDEYSGQEGIIHISEISPGRIRTVRDFVKENKTIYCKVLRYNKKYGNLELSLRRVSTSQKLKKIEGIKQGKRALKIVESLAQQIKKPKEALYKELDEKIGQEYDSLFEGFQAVTKGDKSILVKLGVNDKVATELEKIIKQRIKPPEVKIIKEIEITCSTTEEIEAIKAALKKVLEFVKKKKYKAEITYVSAPKYVLSVSSEDYKLAEAEAKEILDLADSSLKEEGAMLEVAKK